MKDHDLSLMIDLVAHRLTSNLDGWNGTKKWNVIFLRASIGHRRDAHMSNHGQKIVITAQESQEQYFEKEMLSKI